MINVEDFMNEVVKYPHQSLKTIGEALDKSPTIDAVPVIRCKDCKHRDEEYTDQFGGIWCDMHGEVEISKNYFCASGEQKDGEQDE